MFSKKDYSLFILALFLILIGYCCMALDPIENGFGTLTLWIAPPLLLVGFILPVGGIIGLENIKGRSLLRQLKVNTHKRVFGFLVFIVSFVTYLITLEPTASLWDCSEFIASAYKLQVPHTPGTPLSLLVGHFFTMLSLGDTSKVAWCINMMSAFFSALTVFLVYHIIYYLVERITDAAEQNFKPLALLSSICGSLSLAFSDTFWFSAVEAETYGIACFFLVLLIWLILKGNDTNEPLRSRYLILIFYIGGLSYCIHPMCLLALPVLPFVWYVNKEALSLRKIIIAVSAGLAIVLVINRFVAVGIFELAFSFDLFFVNSLHLPFYSGGIFLLTSLVVIFYVLLRKFQRFAPFTWSVVFLLAGFLPYLMLFIRSSHNPPIDEYSPQDLSMIKAYMNRESYGSSPLLFGPYFDAQIESVSVKKKHYVKAKDRYVFTGTLSEYHYDKLRETILPRMYSNDPNHVQAYQQWSGLEANEKPNFADNLSFMFDYQLGHMYFRYLLWNFAGRESDQQNSAWILPWDNGQISETHQNRALNQYWMLPLVIGLLGMFYQYKKERKGLITVFIFFMITGVILALYLNSPPVEPRERDYIYVGSFIAFTFWIGVGIRALYALLPEYKGKIIGIGIISIGVPCLMLYQNFDDHNRAGRTFQIDNARNILASCQPNAILFTGGDNDTFPLWYLQEVEGYRTDIRVMVLSYFNTDWYINQLRKKYYQSEPFSFTLDEKAYTQYGPNDVLYVQESIKEGIDIKKYLQLLKEEHAALKVNTSAGDYYNMLPSRVIKFDIDREMVAKNFGDTSWNNGMPIALEMTFRVTENFLQKNALAVLDLVVSNDWRRPIYFNFTSLNTLGINLDPYVIQEGNVYRLAPIENNSKDIAMDTELSYKNLIEKADYSNLADASPYFNYEDYHLRIITPVRQSFNTLAAAYIEKGNLEMAEKVMSFAVERLYKSHLPPSYTNLQAADILIALGRDDLAKSLCGSLFDFSYDELLTSLNRMSNTNNLTVYLVEQSAEILNRMGDSRYLSKIDDLGLSRPMSR